jgi:thiamine biosynthesis lipoprotein
MTTGAEVLRFSHEAMATVFEVRCVHADATYARQAAQAAFALVDRLEQEHSRFLANSDVARINALGAGEATRVSPATMECLEIARLMFEVTAGAFDISLGTGLEALDLLPEEFTVHAHAAGVSIDLGGIAKGYAVDRVADLLDEWHVRRALVHGGQSSVRALEAPPDRDGWELTLSAPEPDERRVLARLSARQRALSASGTRKRDHIVDPRTGAAAWRRAAWVALPGGERAATSSPATVAETLSTAFMLLSREEAAAICRVCPGVEAWLVEEGRLVHLEPAAPNGA